MSNLSGSLSGDGRVSGAVVGSLLQKPDLPRECMRAVEDCYRLMVCLGSPRLMAWRDTVQGPGSVELPALRGAGRAIKAGLLAVSVVLFGQGRGRGWPLLGSRLGDPISLSSESVFKGRGGASVAPSS